jgi:hypothetical protein
MAGIFFEEWHGLSKLNIMLDIATAYPYRLCHYNINKIILGPCPISHFPNIVAQSLAWP